ELKFYRSDSTNEASPQRNLCEAMRQNLRGSRAHFGPRSLHDARGSAGVGAGRSRVYVALGAPRCITSGLSPRRNRLRARRGHRLLLEKTSRRQGGYGEVVVLRESLVERWRKKRRDTGGH